MSRLHNHDHKLQKSYNSTCVTSPLCHAQAYGLQPEDWNKSALTVVVVGASGDLARKKIFPALFALYHEGMLPEVSARIAAIWTHHAAVVSCSQLAVWHTQPLPRRHIRSSRELGNVLHALAMSIVALALLSKQPHRTVAGAIARRVLQCSLSISEYMLHRSTSTLWATRGAR